MKDIAVPQAVERLANKQLRLRVCGTHATHGCAPLSRSHVVHASRKCLVEKPFGIDRKSLRMDLIVAHIAKSHQVVSGILPAEYVLMNVVQL